MDNESPPKPVATVHDEGVQIDGEIDTSASILETSAQKSLVFKLDCTLLPLFSVAYLLAYMVSITVHNGVGLSLTTVT